MVAFQAAFPGWVPVAVTLVLCGRQSPPSKYCSVLALLCGKKSKKKINSKTKKTIIINNNSKSGILRNRVKCRFPR